MRKHDCCLLRVVAIAIATQDRAISLVGENSNRAFLNFTAGVCAFAQYRKCNLEPRELRIVRAFKRRGLKLKKPYDIMPERVKPIRLFHGAESNNRFCRKFPKLGTSRPEGKLKGGRDAKVSHAKCRT